MKIILTLVFLALSFAVNAQEVISNGTAYEVKGKAIYKNGVDITETLTAEEQKEIKTALEAKLKAAKEAEKAQKQAEKELKKAEKARKEAEKAQKKAEKELKQKQKAQASYDKAAKNHEKAVDTYEKRKNRGDLSPNDEAKWLKKIQKLSESREKASKKLRRS